MEQQLENQRQVELSKLPLFFGSKDKDQFTAEQWVERIRRAKDSARWNDAQTMSAVYNALRAKALAWFESLRRSNINQDVWEDFLKAFLEAYSTTKTSRTTTLNLADLRQGGNECVVDFYPRVIRVIDDIEAMTPANFAAPAAPFPAEFLAIQAFVAVGAAVKRDCVNTLVKTGATQAFNFIGLHLFIAGLKPYLLEEIMKAPPADLYAAFQAASALEKIHTEPRKSTSATQNVYEVAADASDKRDDNGGDEEVEAECAALSARIKNLRSKQKKTGGKTASPNKQSKSKAAAAANNSDYNKCRYCKIVGHLQKNCYTRIQANAPMVDKQGRPFQSNVAQIGGQPQQFQSQPQQFQGQMMQTQQQQQQQQYGQVNQYPPPPFNPFAHAGSTEQVERVMWASAPPVETLNY